MKIQKNSKSEEGLISMPVIKIDIKDLYQFLIAECRYGYKRNNHLMPDGAYDHAKKYLPLMLEEDKDFAINTAKQLCEECVSDQLAVHFYDGKDDDFENRKSAIEFIEKLLEFVHTNDDPAWVPCSYDLFVNNKSIDDTPKYHIYRITTTCYERVTDNLISKNEISEQLFKLINDDEVTFKKYKVKEGIRYDFDNYKLHFLVTEGELNCYE